MREPLRLGGRGCTPLRRDARKGRVRVRPQGAERVVGGLNLGVRAQPSNGCPRELCEAPLAGASPSPRGIARRRTPPWPCTSATWSSAMPSVTTCWPSPPSARTVGHGTRPSTPLVKSGPPGHASPCTVTSSACDVCAASRARCDVPPRSKLALSKLASRAPGAPEPALLVKSGPPGPASPCTVTSSASDVRAPVGSLLRPAALHAGAPQAGVGLRVPRSRPCSPSLALRAPPRRVL